VTTPAHLPRLCHLDNFVWMQKPVVLTTFGRSYYNNNTSLDIKDLTHIAAKNAKNEIILLITPVFINKSKPAKLLSVNYQSNTNWLFG
jgi:hypothetical protein